MPIDFREHKLPNGLTIVAEIGPDAHSAAAGLDTDPNGFDGVCGD